MQYMLLIYQDSSRQSMPTSPEEAQKAYAPWMAYTKALRDAGAMISGSQLAPATAATTVRVSDGRRQVQDGPYADTTEQLAGYYLIEAPDLDAALDWAARCPGAQSGIMEVRPLVGD